MIIKKPRKQLIFHIAKIIVSILAIVSPAALLVYVGTSGLLPAKYLTLAIIAVLILGAITVFLFFRKFKRFNKLAKAVAIILTLLLIVGSVAGYIALSKGLNTLDKIAGKENAVDIETSKPFNVFISGIDTYGDISTVSRSDVNIVATVNPNSRKILLTTVPRDSYVAIALGGHDQMDKLTHAGNYGIESSMKTVANLLETPIDAYARINFSSFIMGVDKVGGITVHNPTAFSSYGENFPAGDIYLNGKRALVYARERKSLKGGDIDRGMNQQRVIEGFLNKVMKARSFSQYEALLSSIGDSVDTNLSSSSLKTIINQQIDHGGSWKTTSVKLNGKGQTGGLPSYAMPNAQLYMYVLDKDSLSSARSKIADALKG